MSEKITDQSPAQRSSLPVIVMTAITWAALLLQLTLSIKLALSNGKSAALGAVIYLGYFTILTNFLVALVLTFTLAFQDSKLRRFFTHPQANACVATSILLVGLGYHFLLREIWDPQGLQWLADVALHYVTPLGFCTLWLFCLPKAKLPCWSPLLWCLYPLAYLCYALLRGLFQLPYPYPFIDVTVIGYTKTLLNGLGLFAAFTLVGSLMLVVHAAAGKLMRK